MTLPAEGESLLCETADVGDLCLRDWRVDVSRKPTDPEYSPTITFALPTPEGKVWVVTHKIPTNGKR